MKRKFGVDYSGSVEATVSYSGGGGGDGGGGGGGCRVADGSGCRAADSGCPCAGAGEAREGAANVDGGRVGAVRGDGRQARRPGAANTGCTVKANRCQIEA